MGETFRSCAAMLAATAVGFAYGAVAGRHAPVVGDSFLLVAGLSVALLVVGSLRRPGAGEATGTGFGPVIDAGLAGYASLLVAAEAFRWVSRDTLLPQALLVLPFLLGIGYAVRRGDRPAACGAGGFFATAVAMLACNSGGGGAGFLSVSCP